MSRLKMNEVMQIKQVFDYVTMNTDKKINKKGLKDLFKLINYQVSEKQFVETTNYIFGKQEFLEFQDFAKIFRINLSFNSLIDITNAFKLVAKDSDIYIPLYKIKEILKENALTKEDIDFLILQLGPFTTKNGFLNYQEFLKSIEA